MPFIDFENPLTLFDALILCRFYRDLYDWPALGRLIQALTGLPADKAALQRQAAAIADLVRRFNLREGLHPAHDRLPPPRFMRIRKMTASGMKMPSCASSATARKVLGPLRWS
jgi:aldehyde:ferredoxin oxidoreductase